MLLRAVMLVLSTIKLCWCAVLLVSQGVVELPDLFYAVCCLCCCCQVLRMSPEEVFAARQRVLDLAEHLNKRTLQVLQTFMPMESDAPQAQAKKQ
jgi:hypothetical protein